MDRAFWQLTRGVRFDHNKFSKEADRFGIKAKGRKEGDEGRTEEGERRAPVILPPPDSREPSEEEDTSGDDEQEEEEITLLGNIKASSSGGKGRKKRKKKSDASRQTQLRREALNHFRNHHRIHVSGTDVPDPLDTTWDGLAHPHGLSPELVSAVRARFQRGPTPVQMQAIPAMLARRELLVCAPTGSGKTAAYLIPLVHHLAAQKGGGGGRKRRGRLLRAVVVAPTRELAMQISREAQLLASCLGLRVKVLDEIVKKTKKGDGLSCSDVSSKCDILVTTPNRLVYLLKEEEDVSSSELMKSVEWLVVDESDKLFESGPKGFRDQLAAVYRACDKAEVYRAMFSATLAVEVEEWCRLNLDNVISVTIGARNTAIKTVEQQLVYVGTEKGKLLALRQLVAEGIKPPVLVFVQTKDRAKDLVNELEKMGVRSDVIHSDRSLLQRDNAVKAFRSGRVWALVCTELMGRGVDFKGVSLVLNYDFPPSTVSYIHRIGRTGRAGWAGKAITFFTDQDKTLLRSVATVVRDSGGSVPDYMMQLKKASRQDKRRLAKRAVERESIRQESKYDRKARIKKEQMIAGSKRRKRKAEEKEKAQANVADVKVKKARTEPSGIVKKKKAKVMKKVSESQ